ncbi:MAG: hypothetical protein AAB401_22890, partial [Acidobacteriota bacterium]
NETRLRFVATFQASSFYFLALPGFLWGAKLNTKGQRIKGSKGPGKRINFPSQTAFDPLSL